MNDPRPTILITGIAGNLGTRLLPFLSEFRVVGVDTSPLAERSEITLHPLDLGRESSCVALVRLLRETGAQAVVHLAFATDPPGTGVAGQEHMWQINVAGTARVMEAISEVNRRGGNVRKFIYSSSVAVYGHGIESPSEEDAPLGAHTLDYAKHKAEADRVVRFRADRMGNCTTYLLRPHIIAGASVENHVMNAIRGRAYGNSSLARKMRRKHIRMPLLLPAGADYSGKVFQFLHVDDMARLIAWLLHKTTPQQGELLTLNVAGAGSPVSIAECAEIARLPLLRLPSEWLCAKALSLLWRCGISSVPPAAFPYMADPFTMNTRRLRELLGGEYEKVIQYSSEAALRDSIENKENSKPV